MPRAFNKQLFQRAINSIGWRMQKVLKAFWKPKLTGVRNRGESEGQVRPLNSGATEQVEWVVWGAVS